MTVEDPGTLQMEKAIFALRKVQVKERMQLEQLQSSALYDRTEASGGAKGRWAWCLPGLVWAGVGGAGWKEDQEGF